MNHENSSDSDSELFNISRFGSVVLAAVAIIAAAIFAAIFFSKNDVGRQSEKTLWQWASDEKDSMNRTAPFRLHEGMYLESVDFDDETLFFLYSVSIKNTEDNMTAGDRMASAIKSDIYLWTKTMHDAACRAPHDRQLLSYKVQGMRIGGIVYSLNYKDEEILRTEVTKESCRLR